MINSCLMKIRYYIKSMRLRTLLLSLAGVSLGLMLAAADYRISPAVVLLTLLTTVCLQILSNICNELGDTLSGVDTAERKGPQYSIGEGGLTVAEMRRLIVVMVVACMISGLMMIHASFGTMLALEPVLLIILGAAAIWSAIRYTLGHNPYGYRGLGDISVFIFFGVVSVLGSYFVAAHALHSWILVLPAAAVGFFSTGVLNVNNMRDMQTDAGIRVTTPIRIGLHKARIYHTILIVAGWICLAAFNLMRFQDPRHWLFVLAAPLFAWHLYGIWTKEGKDLDKMLPLLVVSTFVLCVLMGMGYLAFLL